MNCSVCGSPLLFDRVVFKCACGAYVHAYCVDKHIIDSHRPELEEGYADLNGEFHPKYQPAPAAVAGGMEGDGSASVEGEEAVEAAEAREDVLVPGEEVFEESETATGEGEEEDDS